MASRPGARSNGNDQDRPRDANEEFPPLPETTAPSRAPTFRRSLVPATTFELPPSQTTTSRFARRMPYSTAAQRAERIRHLDDLPQPIPEQFRLEQPREPIQGRTPRELSVPSRWIFTRRVPRVRAVPPPPPPQPLPPPLPPPDLQEIDQSLDEANTAQLRSLLDMTNHINLMTPLLSSSISHMPSANMPSSNVPLYNLPTYDVPFPSVSTTPFNIPPPSRSHDFEHNIRSKRRKIDSNRLVPSFKAFYYGKFGQVEPGKLQMELLSCDGGTFSTQSAYSAENILKDDESVYCTRGNRCNIVLRHQGATVFTLEKLTIKAPKSANYSHP